MLRKANTAAAVTLVDTFATLAVMDRAKKEKEFASYQRILRHSSQAHDCSLLLSLSLCCIFNLNFHLRNRVTHSIRVSERKCCPRRIARQCLPVIVCVCGSQWEGVLRKDVFEVKVPT